MLNLLGHALSQAPKNLRAARQRSLMALAGLASGTACVVAMVNIGVDAGAESQRRFQAMGPDLLLIHPMAGDGHGRSSFDPAEVRRLPEAVASIVEARSVAMDGAHVERRGRGHEATLVGVESNLQDFARLGLRDGRFVSAFDGFAAFAVVGHELAVEMSRIGPALSIGDTIRLDDRAFAVAGILAPSARNPLIPFDFDRAVLVSQPAARRVMADPRIQAVIARMAPGAVYAEAVRDATGYFRAGPRPLAVRAFGAEQVIAGMTEQARLYRLLLGALAAVSLAIGGLGVMNAMVMSVTLRRYEIGLRLAVGARAGDIFAMFLMEAAVLAAAGGAIGSALGLAAAHAASLASDWSFAPYPWVVAAGIGLSAIVGLVSGTAPALAAARLDPAEALRAE